MARQKVAPENRIRAARACENCKRRKQKCNGTFPCDNCTKRSVECHFLQPVPVTGTQATTTDATSPPQGPTGKKRDLSETGWNSTAPGGSTTDETSAPNYDHNLSFATLDSPAPSLRNGKNAHLAPLPQTRSSQDPFPAMNVINSHSPQVEQSAGSDTDEAEMQGASRMLNDGKGRMLYIGDSAPLSYLQTVRQLVSSVIGTSAFTIDPQRHKILEASVSIPLTYHHTYTLPDREAAFFLVDSFFANTKGIMYLFDNRSFKQRVERTYQNPLAAEQSWMCILNLVFANGLHLRPTSPHQSPTEMAILKRLSSDKLDRAEMFFLAAKHLKDSTSGFEDGDFASIQALLLMTLYMLSVGKRNTAWAYFGMAVRLSYALGLHRAEAQRIYEESERVLRSVPRTMLWRSLYVMDRFLSVCLGRPTAIHDEDCSDELFPDSDGRNLLVPTEIFEVEALSASVRAAQILGTILSQIYRTRKISLRIARNIAVRIHEWTQSLPESLQWHPTPTPHDDPGIALGQLHLWMTYFNTIILLTRPFLLLHVKRVISQKRPQPQNITEACASSPAESRVADNPELKKYSAACVRSAIHMIRAVQTIRVKGCLPRRNPYIINWMFIASLIVLTNSFFNVYENAENDPTVQIAILLQQYFAETDPLAARYLQILNAFLEIVTKGRSLNSSSKDFGGQDPIENLFTKQNMVPDIGAEMVPNYVSAQSMGPLAWNWKMPSTGVMQDITATGLNSGDLGDSVEGLVYPGAEELLGPDPGPVIEEVIHFDALWPLNQDSTEGLYPGHVPMYGTTNYL